MFFKQSRSSCAALLFLAGLGACTPTLANRGALWEAETLKEIVVGESTRENVLTHLGSPTQVSTFDENKWYYISRTTQQYSFLDPEVINQKSIEIQFNDEGIVTTINEMNADDAQDISPIDRKTPTYGRSTTFIEQLLGNIGRAGSLNKK